MTGLTWGKENNGSEASELLVCDVQFPERLHQLLLDPERHSRHLQLRPSQRDHKVIACPVNRWAQIQDGKWQLNKCRQRKMKRFVVSHLEEWHCCKAVSVLLHLGSDALQNGFAAGSPTSRRTHASCCLRQQRVKLSIKHYTRQTNLNTNWIWAKTSATDPSDCTDWCQSCAGRSSYPVINLKAAELWDVLGPFHQQEELLLHWLKHVSHTGCLLGADVLTLRWGQHRQLKASRQSVGSVNGAMWKWTVVEICEHTCTEGESNAP